MTSKWYNTGFQEARDGLPSDPPMTPGYAQHANYLDGYRDGLMQIEADARQEARIADRIDGYDRDDVGESPDY